MDASLPVAPNDDTENVASTPVGLVNVEGMPVDSSVAPAVPSLTAGMAEGAPIWLDEPAPLPSASAPPLSAPLADQEEPETNPFSLPPLQPAPPEAPQPFDATEHHNLAGSEGSSEMSVHEELHAFINHTNIQFDRLGREIQRVFDAHDYKIRALRGDMQETDNVNLDLMSTAQRHEIQLEELREHTSQLQAQHHFQVYTLSEVEQKVSALSREVAASHGSGAKVDEIGYVAAGSSTGVKTKIAELDWRYEGLAKDISRALDDIKTLEEHRHTADAQVDRLQIRMDSALETIHQLRASALPPPAAPSNPPGITDLVPVATLPDPWSSYLANQQPTLDDAQPPQVAETQGQPLALSPVSPLQPQVAGVLGASQSPAPVSSLQPQVAGVAGSSLSPAPVSPTPMPQQQQQQSPNPTTKNPFEDPSTIQQVGFRTMAFAPLASIKAEDHSGITMNYFTSNLVPAEWKIDKKNTDDLSKFDGTISSKYKKWRKRMSNHISSAIWDVRGFMGLDLGL